MSEDTRRLLGVLALVPRKSHLEPSWEPRAKTGAIYRGSGVGPDSDIPVEDLELLAERGYLDRIFVERLMICPTCDSHAVNVHEACVTCESSNLKAITTYFHFRCGFIGPEKAFSKEADGLRCPKCKKFLVDLGTDHDSPGVMFECQNCESMFQQPQMGVRCLSCGAAFIGTALQDLRYKDVFAYRLAIRGDEALTSGVLEISG